MIYSILLIIFIHFTCYFFNIDLFECFEWSSKEDDDEIMDNIDSLTKGLEQLKEMNECKLEQKFVQFLSKTKNKK